MKENLENKEDMISVGKCYVLTVMDVDGERKISIVSDNIMLALMKFAIRYKDNCDECLVLSIDVEQVESIE